VAAMTARRAWALLPGVSGTSVRDNRTRSSGRRGSASARPGHRIVVLKPVPPYDFDLSATIFSNGDKQIRRYDNSQFWQVVKLNSNLLLATVRSRGTVDAPELILTLKSTRKPDKDDEKEAGGLIHKLLNLGLDLNSFYGGVKHDAVLRRLTRRLKGLRFMTTASLFEALVYAICEQQISLIVARSIQDKMIKAFGDTLSIGGDTYYAFPTPQALSGASIELLRACGMSQKKAEYVREISHLVAHGELDLEKFNAYKDSESIIEELTKIRGIGLWTAEYALIRGMSRLEALPADDLGIRRSISHYYFHDKKITAAEARQTAGKWGPWRGLASFYLLSGMRLGIEI
jgi:DNA-3-methyladenine glycosylase II